MTYIDRLNQFNRWLESNPLPGNAQLLFFKFLDVFNRAGWPEFVRVDTLKLMQMCAATDKRAAYRARDKLVDAGILEYKKGTKGTPSLFKIRCIFATEYGTEYGTKSGTECGTRNGTLNKTKSKTKTEEETAREDFSFMYDKNLAQVAQHFESVIGYSIPRPAVSAVMEWLKTMPADLICAAIDEAVKANARNWNYAAACLRAWNAKGIRTLDALKAAQAARQKPEKPKEMPRDEKSYDVLAAFMEDDDGLR